MERQFTATVYMIDNDCVLLIYHRKFNKWLPPGGHMDPNETPPESAKREVKEETGLEIEFILQENVWIDRPEAKSFPRPYLCLLEEIQAFGTQPAHQHVDFIYVAHPTGGVQMQNERESDGLRWFTLKEVESLVSDKEIFFETQQTIRKILSDVGGVRDHSCNSVS